MPFCVIDDAVFGPIIMLVQPQIDETQMYVPSPCVNLREESGSCGLEDKKMILIHLFWALWKVIQMVSFFVYSSGLMCKQTERKRKTLYLLKKREKKVMPLTSNLYILIVKT